MGMAEVAAGDGALQTCNDRGLSANRFLFFQLGAGQTTGMNTVLGTPDLQRPHALVFDRVGGHQQFAALLERQTVLPAKIDGLASVAPAKISLQTPRRVIHPGVNHPGIVPGLVLSEGGFLFNQQNGRIRIPLFHLPGGRNTDNAAADEHKVIFFQNKPRKIVKKKTWPGRIRRWFAPQKAWIPNTH